MKVWLSILAAACAPHPDLPPREGAPIEAWTACAPDRRARVACVVDGDTVDLGQCRALSGERVRLLGIDAPEVASASGPTECYGDQATDALRALLSDRDVVLTFDRGCTDPFDRTLAWLLLPDPRDPMAEPLNVSVWMVERGFARLYLERDDFDQLRYSDALLRAEQSARDVGVGLWGECGG